MLHIGIDSAGAINVGFHAGLSLLICFGILFIIIILVNCITTLHLNHQNAVRFYIHLVRRYYINRYFHAIELNNNALDISTAMKHNIHLLLQKRRAIRARRDSRRGSRGSRRGSRGSRRGSRGSRRGSRSASRDRNVKNAPTVKK